MSRFVGTDNDHVEFTTHTYGGGVRVISSTSYIVRSRVLRDPAWHAGGESDPTRMLGMVLVVVGAVVGGLMVYGAWEFARMVWEAI